MDREAFSLTHLTRWIFIALVLGIILGVFTHQFEGTGFYNTVYDITDLLGKIFINVLKMLVVPIVLVSLVVGTCQLQSGKQLGHFALKSIILYIVTTAIAIALALIVASLINVGASTTMSKMANFTLSTPPSISSVILNIFPSNPFKALVDGNMLQIIIFAILIGVAISMAKKDGEVIAKIFISFQEVLMKLVNIILWFAPFGVFCLVAALFTKNGFELVGQLAGYFFTVILVLFIHWLVVYGLIVKLMAKQSPLLFYKRMFSAMFFAFSTSSSNASIPVTLRTAEKRLGVHNSVASFVIPLGATINMDGTAIMQGVATVFIANLYGIHLGLSGYITVITMATLASIGTAGIPSVGLITLTMVLQQVGLPVEAIGLILGVDRLLDMLRTAVNITGDCAVSMYVAKSEKLLDAEIPDTSSRT